jgi:hypothetical protein
VCIHSTARGGSGGGISVTQAGLHFLCLAHPLLQLLKTLPQLRHGCPPSLGEIGEVIVKLCKLPLLLVPAF